MISLKLDMIRLHFIVGLLLFAFQSNAQNQLEVTVEWMKPAKMVFNESEFLMPQIKNQGIDGLRLNVHYQEEVASKYNASLALLNYSTSATTVDDIKYLEKFAIEVPTEFVPELAITNGGGKRYLVVNFFPYIKEQGQIKRIEKVFITKSTEKPLTTFTNKDFVSESVLKEGSGDWYKISVSKDGIYKIDKTFLQSMGVNVESLNPNHINIYGNADGRLPERNSEYRTDDLAKNSILIVGESDNVFDEEDYILFYGWGPDRWYAKGDTAFVQDKNIYSNFSYYFININPVESPKRIQTASLITDSPTHLITDYNYRAIHELDLVNMVSAGQRWYGELFDVELSRNFNFPVPNAAPGYPSHFRTALATNAKSSGNTQQYSLNGTTLLNTSLPVISDWGRSNQVLHFTSGSTNLNLTIAITRNTADVLTYLDRIELNTRRRLVFIDNQFNFSDLSSIGVGNIGAFTISNMPSQGFIWNITQRQNPVIVQGDFSGSSFTFLAAQDTVNEYVASDGTLFFTPTYVGRVDYQNLHGLDFATSLIVTHKSFLSQANRLANLHRANGMSVHVVTTEQVYNEFSSGALDPVAIRMFAKMFYDRSISSPDDRPKYLTLFGDGTFDPKNRVANNNNFIPAFQVVGGSSSEHHIYNIVTDDFYAMLDDGEAISSVDKVDIGVGRLLISDNQQAKEQVDKIEHYMKNGSTMFAANNLNCIDGVSTSTFGDWRTRVVNIADDENYFFEDQEGVYQELKTNFRDINVDKLYLDAFPRTITAGGYRFPQVYDAIVERFDKGSLLINYVGHGGEVGLASERVVTIPQIQALKNIDNLPLFVSATCEFTKFDDPARVSAGELLSMNPTGGAIALMTTTRSVFYTVNSNTVTEFFKNVFVRNTDFRPRTLGEITMETKVDINDGDNKMAFCLIGDPALTLALPRHKIVIDSINGLSPGVEVDTLQALSRIMVKAHIEDFSGNVLSGFNGVATPSLYDKPKQLQTLGNNPGGSATNADVQDFELQRNLIYRGKSTVTNGYFQFEFVSPKDIDYAYGNGKFSLYANSTSTDGIGEESRVIVGGINPNGLDDNVGPEINLFLNSENFVNGGITNETPYLIAKIFDENGVNTVGNGIGHDITVVLDDETSNPIVLNQYYSSDLDTYQSGEIRYQFVDLEPGEHTLTLKVWDVNNNSSEQRLEFVVQEEQDLQLDHVLNYPNPFTTNTEFYFEHNQCCTDLETQIQIFTVTGRLVKTINRQINTVGYRSEGIQWDGKDDFGDQLAKGVYVYRLKVTTPDGLTAEKLEKLVLLR